MAGPPPDGTQKTKYDIFIEQFIKARLAEANGTIDDPMSDKLWAQIFGYLYKTQNSVTAAAKRVINSIVDGRIADIGNRACNCVEDASGMKCHNNLCVNRRDRYFCDESCGPTCQNQSKDLSKEWLRFRYFVDNTLLDCITTKKSWIKDEYMFEYVGDVLLGYACPGEQRAYPIHDRTFPHNQQLLIRTNKRANISHNLKHSLRYNVILESWIEGYNLRLLVKAARDISHGEIITAFFPQMANLDLIDVSAYRTGYVKPRASDMTRYMKFNDWNALCGYGAVGSRTDAFQGMYPATMFCERQRKHVKNERYFEERMPALPPCQEGKTKEEKIAAYGKEEAVRKGASKAERARKLLYKNSLTPVRIPDEEESDSNEENENEQQDEPQD